MVMLLCLIPTIVGAGMMYGLDPTGVPKHHAKGWLLFASYLTGTFGAVSSSKNVAMAKNVGV